MKMIARVGRPFVGLFLLAALPAAVYAQQQSESTQTALDPSILYSRNCAHCHGDDGRARTVRGFLSGAQNLTNPAWQDRVKDPDILEAINKGPGLMPAYEKKFTQSEIEGLVVFVRSLQAGQDKKGEQ